MKNYVGLLEYIQNKGRVLSNQRRLQSYLVVDQREYAENVEEIRESASDPKMRSLIQVLLKRQLSDQESLLLSFAEGEEAPEKAEEESIDLDIKKNFFYVINPQGKIIDCAKIYSFMHEDNVYQRIVAKILKDIDEVQTGKKLNL